MASRPERERAQYDRGLQRAGYERVLRHSGAFWNYEEMIRGAMAVCQGKDVLEIGSHSWGGWLEKNGIYPASLHAINISEAELQKGRDESRSATIKPVFHLMDAHALDFDDGSFDVVFGSSILHHLNVEIALGEVSRVLRQGGRIVFREPLGINPVAKLVRYLTPRARTIDEQPFRFKELAALRDHFAMDVYPSELLSVPFGVLSGLLLRNPKNPLTYVGFVVDKSLLRIAPFLKYWYRQVLITGQKRCAAEGP